VVATECDSALAANAKAALADLGLGNVTVKAAAVAEGDSANAPYDVIILDGATEIVPERLYRQLKEGGRLVGVFAMTRPQRAMIVTRSYDDFGSRAQSRFCRGLSGLRGSFFSSERLRIAFEIEVWPGCPMSGVSHRVTSRGVPYLLLAE
jgi:protein-L-isoaspartate O-methyltransferase